MPMRNGHRWTDHPLFRLLVLGILSIPLLVMITTPRQKGPKPDNPETQAQAQVSEPDSYMTGLFLRHYTPEGTLQYEFRSRRAAYQSNSQATILNEPQLLFIDTPKPWAVDSNFGKLLGNGEKVELWDNVNVRRTDDSLQILTTAMTLYPDRNYAETDRPVTMDGTGTHTEAVGLKAYLKENRLLLLSDVRSLHEAKPH